jgi:N-acetylmuramoyl-L-alanine amidase
LKSFLLVLISALSLCISIACSGKDRENDSLVSAASQILEMVSRSDDAIPDSVLNAAKCIITIPPQHTAAHDIRGVASCRANSDWQTPTMIMFSGRAALRAPSALMIAVLSERAAKSLQAGQLEIERSKRKAPLASTKALVTAYDLSSDYMTYEVENTGALHASEATGHIRMPSRVYSKDDANRRKEDKAVRKYEHSLESFLNTIVPTGIVIHHTAAIQSDKLPKGEKEVDSYHQQRGFKIECSGKVYHVAYHYLILPNGTVQHGRPDRCEGAHARGYNSYLGISLIGDFSRRDNHDGSKGPENPSDKQMKALEELCRSLQQKYNIPLQHIVRHSDIASTDCPGDQFPFNQLLSRLQQGNNFRSDKKSEGYERDRNRADDSVSGHCPEPTAGQSGRSKNTRD